MATRYSNSLDWTGPDNVTVTSLATATTGDQMLIMGTPKWSTVPSQQLWNEGGSVICTAGQRLGWLVPALPTMYTRFYIGRPSTPTTASDIVVARWAYGDTTEGVELWWQDEGRFSVWYRTPSNTASMRQLSTFVTNNTPPYMFAFDCYLNAGTGGFTVNVYDYKSVLKTTMEGNASVTDKLVTQFWVGNIAGGVETIRVDEVVIAERNSFIGAAPPKPTPYDFAKVEVAQVTGAQLDRTFFLDSSAMDTPRAETILPVSSVSISETVEETDKKFLSINPPTGTIGFSEWVDPAVAPVVRAKKNATIEVRYLDTRLGPDGVLLFVGLVREIDLTVTSEINDLQQVRQTSTIQLGDLTTLWIDDPLTWPAEPTGYNNAGDVLSGLLGSGNIVQHFGNPISFDLADREANVWPDGETRSRMEWIRSYTDFTGLTTVQYPSYDPADVGKVLVTDETIKFEDPPWEPSPSLDDGAGWQTSVQYGFPDGYRNPTGTARVYVFPTTVNLLADTVVYSFSSLGVVCFGVKPGARLQVPSGQIGVVKSSQYSLTPRGMTVSVELAEPIDWARQKDKFSLAPGDY